MFVDEFRCDSPIPSGVSDRNNINFDAIFREDRTIHERSLEAVTKISVGPPVPIRPGTIAVISRWWRSRILSCLRSLLRMSSREARDHT